MKFSLIFALSFSMCQGFEVPRDKAMHVAAGFAISSCGTFVAKEKGLKHPELYGFALGCFAGLAKEVYDKRHPKTHTCEAKDALATIGGASLTFAIRF